MRRHSFKFIIFALLILVFAGCASKGPKSAAPETENSIPAADKAVNTEAAGISTDIQEVNIEFTQNKSATDFKLHSITARHYGNSYAFTVFYDSGKERYCSIFGGSYQDITVIPPAQNGEFTFDITADEISGIDSVNLSFLDMDSNNSEKNDVYKMTVPSAELASLSVSAQETLSFAIYEKYESTDISIDYLTAVLDGDDYKFQVGYDFGSERILSFFNPPQGDKVTVYEKLNGAGVYEFQVPVSSFTGITQISMRVVGSDDKFDFASVTNIRSLARLGPAYKAVDSSVPASGSFISNLTEYGTGLAREVPANTFSVDKPISLSVNSDVMRWSAQGIGSADVRWLNCRDKLSEEEQAVLIKCLPNITFNSSTVFPEDLPNTYDPAAILEAGKNPGLGVRSLHEKGITGSGVGIAIIDQVLYTSHPEYSENLALYEEIHIMPNEVASMHGSGVTSIAVGKSCGAAPGAKLYYWGVNFAKDLYDVGASDDKIAFAEGLAVAVDRILEINRELSANEKIRVISISRGFSNLKDAGVKTFLEAVERAKKAGIFVITTSTNRYYDWMDEKNDFGGLGKADYSGDPDRLSAYTLGNWEQRSPEAFLTRLLVPMDARTTADFTSGDGYVFYSDGGYSWVAPYLAGLYALACQVKPEITPEEFWQAALDTSDKLTVAIQTSAEDSSDYTFQHVINPVKLIEEIKQ